MADKKTAPRARDLNELIRYTMWSVFRVTDPAALDAAPSAAASGEPGRAGLAAEVTQLCEQAAEKGVVTRGCYDVQGPGADAAYMFWWIAPSSPDLRKLL